MPEGLCCNCPRPAYCKGVCRSCYMKVYRQKPDQVAKRKAHHKEHYLKDKDGYKLRQAKWNALNPERRKQLTKEGWKKHQALPAYKVWLEAYNKSDRGRALYRARSANRRSRVVNATPRWAQLDKIAEFYYNCPKGYHVDHIVPLQGKNVSGLHVLSNLQYLEASENLRKHNKFPW